MKKTIKKALLLIFALTLILTVTSTVVFGEEAATGSVGSSVGFDGAGRWIAFSFLGYLLPVAFITLGLVLPRVKKMGKDRMWYVLALSGGVWLLFSIMLTVLILL